MGLCEDFLIRCKSCNGSGEISSVEDGRFLEISSCIECKRGWIHSSELRKRRIDTERQREALRKAIRALDKAISKSVR